MEKQQKLKSLIESLGVSQVDIAKKTGLNRSSLSQVLNGLRPASDDYLLKILTEGVGLSWHEAHKAMADWSMQQALEESRQTGAAQAGQSEALKQIFSDDELLAKYGIKESEVKDIYLECSVLN